MNHKKIKGKIVYLAIVITIIFLPMSVYSIEEGMKKSVVNAKVKQTDVIKKTVVFLGKFQEKIKKEYKTNKKEECEVIKKREPEFFATGFLVDINNIIHLITAKHVIIDANTGKFKDKKMYVFFNSKDEGMISRTIMDIKKKFNVDWIFHENSKVDIAIIPFGIDPQKDDVKIIPDNLFLSSDRIFELYDIFFLSYQPGIEPERHISPIIRRGMVSRVNDDRTFYVDAFVFPGNSGSPVFLKPSPIRFDTGGITIGSDPLGNKFVGIIGSYVAYREVAFSAQTQRPRVVFEENTGLSKVWSVEYIKDIIKSEKFKEQLKKIQKD